MAYLDRLRQLSSGVLQNYSPQYQYGYNPVLPPAINPEIQYNINPPVVQQPTYPVVKSNPTLSPMRTTQNWYDPPVAQQPTYPIPSYGINPPVTTQPAYPIQAPSTWAGNSSSRPVNDTWTPGQPVLNPINRTRSQYSSQPGYNQYQQGQYQQATQPSYADYEQLQYEREKKRRELRDRYSQQNMSNYNYYA